MSAATWYHQEGLGRKILKYSATARLILDPKAWKDWRLVLGESVFGVDQTLWNWPLHGCMLARGRLTLFAPPGGLVE